MSFLGVQAQVMCYKEVKQPHVLELSFSPGGRKSEGIVPVQSLQICWALLDETLSINH